MCCSRHVLSLRMAFPGRNRFRAIRTSGPSFIPDAKFAGSALSGWHTLGQAGWQAENGELVGKGTQGSGWLILDHSYQDTGFYAAFRCTGDCDTGVLLRMTKSANGMTGTYLSVKGHALLAENVTLGADGGIIEREKLRGCGGASPLRSS